MINRGVRGVRSGMQESSASPAANRLELLPGVFPMPRLSAFS